MKKLINTIGGTGFLIFILGASGMDSENIVIPAVMAVIGVVVLLVSSRLDKEFYAEK